MGGGEAELVFVYGTLRQGASNHWRMEGAEWLGEATVRGSLYKVDWYPGLVLDPQGADVVGEIYRVPHELLASLDEFEGVTGNPADEYERVRAIAKSVDGSLSQEVWAWDYRGPANEASRLAGNDWMAAAHPRKRLLFFWVALAPVLLCPIFLLTLVVAGGNPGVGYSLAASIVIMPFVMIGGATLGLIRREEQIGCCWILLIMGCIALVMIAASIASAIW